ncbi:hypothetical protein N8368_00835, partial [Bacteroidia bacterium]|nr:hypothetical protein [Bacteroidia bacterium]
MKVQQTNIQALKRSKMYRFIVAFILFTTSFAAIAEHAPEHGSEEKSFNAGELIMHHVMDNHEIHVGPIHIPLPIILYSKEKGLDMFSSSKISHGEPYNGYIMDHEKIYFVGDNGEVSRDEHGHIDAAKPFDISITKTVFGMF